MRPAFPRLACLLAGVTLLPGCLAELPPGGLGASGVANELARIEAIRGFGVISSTPTEAVIAARGAKVVVRPAAGSCIARDTIETSERSVFLLLTDCALETGLAATTAEGDRLIVAPGFPGLVTIAVAGEERAPLERLQEFLGTPAGQAQLGRGVGEEVDVATMRVVEDVLFVLAEDRDPEAVPLLSRRFWRAFTEVNGRMVLVTVSGFRAHEMGEDEMLAQLVDQVLALRVANGGSEAGTAAGPVLAAAPSSPGAASPEPAVRAGEEGPGEFAPATAPDPPSRGRRRRPAV